MSSLFWVRGLATSVYVKNRCMHSSLTHGTPYELFYGRKPDLGNLRGFGCKTYVYVQKEFRQKLDSQSRLCGVFVGPMTTTANAILLFCPSKEADTKQVTTRSVIFNEDEFFFQKPESFKEITHGSEVESKGEEPVVARTACRQRCRLPRHDEENHFFPN